ncbi:MAG: IS982 family transposase, partial [Bacteroidales bacterium]
MFEKLHILLIYSILGLMKSLIHHQHMHNLYTIFSK